MRQLQPQFRGRDGRLVDDPLHAAGPQPAVDLDGLARLFTSLGLIGEFAPSSFLQHVELVWPVTEPGPTDDSSVARVFGDAVSDLCGDAATVGIALSGGLDSLAVLVHVVALRPRRRVVAYVVDLIDDNDHSASVVVQQLLVGLGIADRVQVVVVDAAACAVTPSWSPFGPRPDALPTVNATIAYLAATAGVEVLLSGDGADELLAVPRFATTAILRRFGMGGARRYVADLARSGPGVLGELVAAMSAGMPAMARARLYWAANWPEWTPPRVSAVVAPPRRETAAEWAHEWVIATITQHAAAERSWASADATDAWWPRTYRPPSGDLPEGSPFLHPAVVAAGRAIPLAARYAPTYNTRYHRMKAQIVQLFPDAMRAQLPRRKQLYRTALAVSVAEPIDVPIATRLGLLDADALDQDTDTATRMVAQAVESWLAGAQAAGIRLAS
jgi:asparagine synthase (glutamine-hydrolysing)